MPEFTWFDQEAGGPAASGTGARLTDRALLTPATLTDLAVLPGATLMDRAVLGPTLVLLVEEV